ncbi:YtnP family quorum-quenching lactonase [Neobacillus thermocopriae]|uniref:MBL fold metallo-hydrolase n=1 Tax=Neobacillus thermocopriae TaxID=1215031 RepID=A0A6B3TNR9_9BACI|nr:MBL fold metallo-hydrolase [Neobacillus thermocopriae]MED3622781.1 MBL fold metallo-hydrolase [Neobacillus thermocopriae]MED3714217.1 MBL fold metallo-hydrolase [Neobacillus thermocopriae]NEX78624.1 MBL fold metallo-hydrolase [Neobacillus thermocopriae]
METLKVGNVTLTWLSGGVTNLDGGAMFGVVPKALWSKKYPANEKNQIELPTDPILVQTGNKNILIEAGLGKGKLSEKQLRNFGVTAESNIEGSLQELGLTTNDIDYVLMTHMHNDHAGGLTKIVNGTFQTTFPNAKIVTSSIEWEEMRNPNIRSKATYFRENWEAVESQVTPFEQSWSFGPIQMIHTGGHSNGHSIIIIEDGGEMAIHFGDLMGTHAHQNVLWVMAYDDYPMDSIRAKQKWLPYALERNAWFTFYHDAFYRAVKWGQDGKEITESLKRQK